MSFFFVFGNEFNTEAFVVDFKGTGIYFEITAQSLAGSRLGVVVLLVL